MHIKAHAAQISATHRRAGLALKLFYFVFYGSIAVYLTFLAPYLRGLGFSGSQIGLITMLGALAGIGSSLGWAVLADRMGAATRALRMCMVVALLPLLYLPFARTPGEMLLVIVFHSLAAPAVVPLIDSVTFEWLRASNAGSFTRTRLFGTIGGLSGVQVVGGLLTWRGEQPADMAIPLSMLCMVATCTVLARFLPMAPSADRPPSLRDLGALIRDRRLRLFLILCLVYWLGYAPYNLLFGVFLRDSGLPSSSMALIMVGGSAAEALTMFVFPVLERRFRTGTLLALMFAGTAVRWAFLSVSDAPAGIAALQILHGVVLGLFWSTEVKAIGDLVPARLRVTGYALFAALVVGGGNTLGFWLAGVGYDHLGSVAALFEIATAIALLSLVLVLFVGRAFEARTREHQPGALVPLLPTEKTE